MNLYPILFTPILKSIIWGGSDICKFKGIDPIQEGIGESWEISGVHENISVVSNGVLSGKNLEELIIEYKDRMVGKSIYAKYKNTFPLLIKFIDARDNLSIQVHPDDTLAKERHNSFGKTEMWYVINATEKAFLYSGFNQKIDSELYPETIKNNTFVDYLAEHDVKKGDAFFLPAGRVHAIGAGTFIAEIQQTSNITYRIYDYNRKDANGNSRELHTELAKDAIDYNIHDQYRIDYERNLNEPVKLESCEYFTTNLLELDKTSFRDYSQTDSFVIFICMNGSCDITDNNGYKTNIKQGQSVLIPAETKNIEISPSPEVLMLETFI